VQLFEGGQAVTLPPNLIRQGDLIQFSYRGHVYKILGPSDGEGYVNGGQFIIQPRHLSTPLPAATPTATLPYQIFRQPVKSADSPATLPVGALSDLQWSGIGNTRDFAVSTPADPILDGAASARKPVIVTFGPSGNLDSVQYWSVPKSGGERRAEVVIVTPITPVYLLVGQPVGDTNTTLNHVNQENIWVAINPQSGLVTTSEVGYSRDQLPSSPTQQDLVTAIGFSRQFARSAQNMGGR
jgi:hypothetical protein